MTAAASPVRVRESAVSASTLIWAAAIAAVAVLYVAPGIAPWAVKYPDNAVIPVADWISTLMAWLKSNFTWLTRGVTDVLNVPLQAAFNLLAKGWKLGAGPDAPIFPRLSWVGVCADFAIAGYAFDGWRLAALAAACMTYITW